jgi:hypothetical protein
MTQHQVLFCPFCREGFEGMASCPDHALRLVPRDQIAPTLTGDDEPGDDEPNDRTVHPDERAIALLDPRHGRSLVALGGGLAGAALLLELAPLGGRPLPTYQIATVLPSLWTLLLVCFCVFYVLARRRTPRALRSLRVLVPLLGGVVMLTLAMAVKRLGTLVMSGTAAYVMVASALLLVWGGARLGGSARVDP